MSDLDALNAVYLRVINAAAADAGPQGVQAHKTVHVYVSHFNYGSDTLYLLPLERNKKGSWRCIAVEKQGQKRVPDKGKITHVGGRFPKSYGGTSMPTDEKDVPLDSVPPKVIERFLEKLSSLG